MPFGPNTLTTKSLGGSESSALLLADALAQRGHSVELYCELPPPGEPDHWPSGKIADNGVRFIALQQFPEMNAQSPVDLLIVVRDPGLAILHSAARKKVLWMHDIATKKGMGAAFGQMSWAIDEVWTVSEWHRQQVHKATEYPLENIFALRNGIAKQEVLDLGLGRTPRQLFYAARPERGLDNLIKPGGIMDNLPDFHLKVAMYQHFPDHMKGYYEQVFRRMAEMPNVEYVGGLSNKDVRQLLHDSEAYIYPTQFEETSCILAREAIEQRCPLFTTRVGALPETVQDCGVYFEDYLRDFGIPEPEKGSPGWCKLFASFVREGLAIPEVLKSIDINQGMRDDLYWDGVAEMIETRAPDNASAKLFSVAWSMVEDGDVIAAKAFIDNNDRAYDSFTAKLRGDLDTLYPFLLDPTDPGYVSLADYYDKIYSGKAASARSECHYQEDFSGGARLEAIALQLAELPDGQRIVEFGCGPGHLLAPLAKKFPQHEFFGIEISETAVRVLNEGAAQRARTNLSAIQGDEMATLQFSQAFDFAICSEVLEHVPQPWKTAEFVEAMVKPGGRCLFTTPYGPWEPMTFRVKGQWEERAHIWLLDRPALREMFEHKQEKRLLTAVRKPEEGPMLPYGRLAGQYIFSYEADHTPIKPIDVENKWKTHNVRQTCAAAIIAMNNEDTILRCLESIAEKVQIIQIAHGPSTDRTREIIDQFAEDHKHVQVRVIDVPQIKVYEYGFDDARNASAQGLNAVVDWILWIDTDEFLSGDFTPFLRNNDLDAYIIPQHHHTCEPRGAPPQVDHPARLFKTTRGYRAIGHIHEHFELPEGGPGRAYELPGVDIAHTGYVNEEVRQVRFHRNFAFLQWDHQDEKPRKLHYFLWFRDLIHWMRIHARENRPEMARQLAEEAISYYNANWETMSAFGPGFAMSQQYLNEAYQYLGRGVPIAVTVRFADRAAEIGTRFESYDQLERLVKFLVEPELKDRQSQYYG